MTRYRARTIKERGGLKAHLAALGANYEEFKRLRRLPGQNNTSIAGALSEGRERPFRPITISRWIQVDNEEMKEADNAKN